MRLAALSLVMLLAGCAPKRAPLPPPPALRGPAYVDLQAEWRVKVITPILRSGGFVLKSAELKEEGPNITVHTGDEFEGYETSIYAVSKQKAGGVRVKLEEVLISRDGKVIHGYKSIAPRLKMRRRQHYVRLLYTLKVSDQDHNMAILAADTPDKLKALTERVQSSPATECHSTRHTHCEWVPAGIAVRPERPNGATWQPAN